MENRAVDKEHAPFLFALGESDIARREFLFAPAKFHTAAKEGDNAFSKFVFALRSLPIARGDFLFARVRPKFSVSGSLSAPPKFQFAPGKTLFPPGKILFAPARFSFALNKSDKETPRRKPIAAFRRPRPFRR